MQNCRERPGQSDLWASLRSVLVGELLSLGEGLVFSYFLVYGGFALKHGVSHRAWVVHRAPSYTKTVINYEKCLLTFERVMVPPVGHDVFLDLLIQSSVHTVQVLGLVNSASLPLSSWIPVAGCLQF